MPIHERWVLGENAAGSIDLPLKHPALRAICVNRGIVTPDQYRRFASPSLDDLHDGSSIHGMSEACERIERAIARSETILIYGDYDVDGVTSIVLLTTVLRLLGARVDHVVPHRLVDGYGLKTEVLERKLDDSDVRLVITVDCGISSVEPVRQAIDRGIDVIITDHHLPPEDLPSAAAVLNPKQPGCLYPFKELAGVGVTFKLCCELTRRAGRTVSLESLLKIAAIGTIADVAPLTDENRTIVKLGLVALSSVNNRGLRTFLVALGLYGRPLMPDDVGFRIGPRINAAGRIESADTAIRLFSARDDDEAMELVAELERLNARRREIEQEVLASAKESAGDCADRNVIFVAGEGWHKGVLGLTAGRLAREFHRPALVAAIHGSDAVGSGRSNGRIDIHRRLSSISHLFTHFGGHEFACGFSFRASDREVIAHALDEAFRDIDPQDLIRTAEIDAALDLGDLDASFFREHETLQPFGAGNIRPRFLIRDVEAAHRREFAPGCHALTVQSGSVAVPMVAWPDVQHLVREIGSQRSDLIVELEPDRWERDGFRLTLIDAAPRGMASLTVRR